MIKRGEGEGEKRAEQEGKYFMDWDLKTPSWDLTELERQAVPHIAPFVGSSSLGGQQKSRGDCSVDLKLGRFGDFGEGSVDKWKDPRELTMVSSPLGGSSKRARAPNNGTQVVSCLVDGCDSDLSNCRDYHRRHKVCEVHSKTTMVMVGGQEQRFCQQCSRFHLLVEFDEVKRSCRKRLDGHNRRRRKPQPESLPASSGSLLSGHRGNRLSPFYNPQIYPTITVANRPSWNRVVKTEEEATLYNRQPQMHLIDRQNPFCRTFPRGYNGGEKQFPFLLDNHHPALGNRTPSESSSGSQPLLNTIASSDGGGGGSQKMFSDRLNQATQALDSDCALSLLSSPLAQTSGISLSLVVQHDPIPLAQPLMMGLQHYNGLDQYSCSHGMEDETVGSVLGHDTSNTNLHCHGIFRPVSDGSSGNEVHETLPFSWE